MNERNVSTPVSLDVYVGAHCGQCPEARALAEEMAREFPALAVRIVDLDEPGVQPPPEIFAVPTFLLNGKVVSLGTPYREELARQIRLAFKTSEGLVQDEHAPRAQRKNRLPT